MIVSNDFSKNVLNDLISFLRHDGEIEYELLECVETDNVLLYVLYNVNTYKYICISYSIINNYIPDNLTLNCIVLGENDFYSGDYKNFMSDYVNNGFCTDITDYGYCYTDVDDTEKDMLYPYLSKEKQRVIDMLKHCDNMNIHKALSYRIYLI